MTHYAPASGSPRLLRRAGPLGGVASGFGTALGVNTGLVRLGMVAAALIFGPVVVALYVALWYLLPVDRSVPVEFRPERPPIALVIILLVLFGIGVITDITFGLISLVTALVPTTLIVLGVVLVVLMLRRR